MFSVVNFQKIQNVYVESRLSVISKSIYFYKMNAYALLMGGEMGGDGVVLSGSICH